MCVALTSHLPILLPHPRTPTLSPAEAGKERPSVKVTERPSVKVTELDNMEQRYMCGLDLSPPFCCPTPSPEIANGARE